MNPSVIVTTYNRPDALELVLRGFAAQADRDFELLIADDGSTDETRQVIERFRPNAPFAVQHVWQEDAGFRAAAIRNKASLQSRGDYLIFTDGDCVPAPDFVANHRRLAEPGYFLAGNRILLSESFSADAVAQQLPIFNWPMSMWRTVRHRGGINRLMPLLRLPLPGFVRKLPSRRWEGVKTCNLSLWRSDFERINGFDERYCGWGLEDSDLVIRLLRAGVQHKSARFAAPVFHLWHREFDRLSLPENRQRLEAVLQGQAIEAEEGLRQHRATGQS